MIEGPVAVPEWRGMSNCALDVAFRSGHGIAQTLALRESCGDRRGKRAAGAVGAPALDVRSSKLDNGVAIVEQIDCIRFAEMTSGDDDGTGAARTNLDGGSSRILQRRDWHLRQYLRLLPVWGDHTRTWEQSGADKIDGVVVE